MLSRPAASKTSDPPSLPGAGSTLGAFGFGRYGLPGFSGPIPRLTPSLAERPSLKPAEPEPARGFVPWIPESLQQNLAAAAALSAASLPGFQYLQNFGSVGGAADPRSKLPEPKLATAGSLSSAPAQSSSDGKPNDGEDMASLLHKVHKRLAQNRESAKKCRQRKKAYMQKLEEEVVTLRGTTKGGVTHEGRSASASGAGLPATFQQAVATPPTLSKLQRWRLEHWSTVDSITQAVLSNLPDDKLRVLVTQCLENQQQELRLREEMLTGEGFPLLVAGEHLQPCERFMLWMGGLKPTDVLKLCVEVLSNDGLAEEQQRRMAQVRDTLLQQEDALFKGFELLQGAVRSGIVSNASFGHRASEGLTSSSSSQLFAKVDAMRVLMLHADELRNNMWSDLKHTLTLRQFAMCLTMPVEMLRRVSSLYEAFSGPTRSSSSEGARG